MNSKYWEEEIETMPREQLRQLQLQRLKKTIAIAANSPFYKKVFQENNITADSINSLEDIRKIPFTNAPESCIHHTKVILERSCFSLRHSRNTTGQLFLSDGS